MTHMNEPVGIRELQQHASKVVARAAGGEEIEITDRGRPVARIVPLRRSQFEQLADAGRLRPPVRPMTELPPLIEVDPGALTASEILAEMRADER
jgi:prevent-host-death family protein